MLDLAELPNPWGKSSTSTEENSLIRDGLEMHPL